MKAFLAILILVDLDDMGTFRVHWTTDPLLEKPGFRRIMSRNRFQMILRFLHVVDNSQQVPRGQQGYDRQFKIRNMIEKLVIAWNTCFQMEKELSVDECMVAFKGRVSMLQYMKSKPTKWGLKGRVLAGCKTGYVHN